MGSLKVYLDEDVHNLIAEALRLRGWEARTTVEAGNQQVADVEQIRYAARNGYCIVTYNVSDFPRLHDELLSSGEGHSGIIVATQDRPGANARALLLLASTFTANDFLNQLLYLNNWLES